MSNPFKVDDKITINADIVGVCEARDTTAGRAYKVLAVDTPDCNPFEPHDVLFIDDVGDRVILFPEHVTLAKE